MRRLLSRAGKAAAVILLLFLLAGGISRLMRIQELGRLGVYEMESALDKKTAEIILEQAADIPDGEDSPMGKEQGETENRMASGNGSGAFGEAAKYPHDVVFFREKKNQAVENPQWYRRTKTTAVEIIGDSTLLFPFGFPLEAGDVKGCLLGEDSARELFGGTEVVGAEILYEGNTYEIRGILQERDILVIEGGEETCFSYAGIFGENPLQKDRRIAEVQNLGGILLTEIPFRFYGTIIRMEIVGTAAFLYGLAGTFLCKKYKGKKSVKKGVFWGAGFCGAVGIIFILSLTAYRMPDKISDLSWWGNYFREEREGFASFFAREEMFLQEDYKQYLLPGKR